MMTVRQIERDWSAKDYTRLYRELIAARPEAVFRLEVDVRAPLAAALAVIRLDELSQSYAPLYTRLLRAILTAQESDGGWGDPVTTAVCLRALLCGQGDGAAVDRGMTYLAGLQKDEGTWPNLPLRRMPGDAHVSAFILCQLAESPAFREAVRLDDAVIWFRRHADELDDDTRQLWDRAATRCRRPRFVAPPAHHGGTFWSNVA